MSKLSDKERHIIYAEYRQCLIKMIKEKREADNIINRTRKLYKKLGLELNIDYVIVIRRRYKIIREKSKWLFTIAKNEEIRRMYARNNMISKRLKYL